MSGLAAVITVAGCSSPTDSDQATQAPTGQKEQTTTATATTTPTTQTTTTTASTEQPPGLNQIGGPNDLQTSPTVQARVLSEDKGGGRVVFDPAIVWIKSGTSVTWKIKDLAHSATAYHPNNGDHPLRIPTGAQPFDSKSLSPGKTYTHTFDTTGVYNYYCIPHEGQGMVGLVIVNDSQGGPGTKAPDTVKAKAARKRLAQQLQIAGITG